MDILEQIISSRPSFHSSETEITRTFEPTESLLDEKAARRLATPSLVCYGIGQEVLRFLGEAIGQASRTLETGAGCSTLVFAIRGAKHVAITPSEGEIQRIRAYAADHDIGLNTVEFIPESSEDYLPRCDAANLDVVLIDGKHAFPWPIIDWFFTAERLKRGGLMVLDDAQMQSVRVLADFMSADPGWDLVRSFSDKTLVFSKVRDKVLDVAWHMQPWTVSSPPSSAFPALGILGRMRSRLARLLQVG